MASVAAMTVFARSSKTQDTLPILPFLPDRAWATLMAFCVGNDVVAPGSKNKWYSKIANEKLERAQNVLNGFLISDNPHPRQLIPRNNLSMALKHSKKCALEIVQNKSSASASYKRRPYKKQSYYKLRYTTNAGEYSTEVWPCWFEDLALPYKGNHRFSNLDILCEALKWSSSLTYFSVQGWKLVDIRPIAELVKCSTSIEEIELTGNGIVNVEPLVEALAVNRSIKKIWLENNPIPRSGIKKLREACKKHTTLDICMMPTSY